MPDAERKGNAEKRETRGAERNAKKRGGAQVAGRRATRYKRRGAGGGGEGERRGGVAQISFIAFHLAWCT